MMSFLRSRSGFSALLALAFLLCGGLTSAFAQVVVLYVPNTSANSLAEFSINGSGALTAFPSQSTNNLPYTVAVTPNNQFMYVGDLDGFLDEYVVAQNGTLTTVPGPVPSAGNVTGMAIDASGKFLYTSF